MCIPARQYADIAVNRQLYGTSNEYPGSRSICCPALFGEKGAADMSHGWTRPGRRMLVAGQDCERETTEPMTRKPHGYWWLL
jgi:hypothetical protein